MKLISIILIVICLSIGTLAIDLQEDIIENTEAEDLARGGRGGRPRPRPSPSPSPKPSPGRGNTNSGFNSFLGFIVGPIIFISSFACIYYNERRAAI